MELKADAFKPGHAGQLDFSLAAVDARIKAPDDNPAIGPLLCKTRNHLVAEYVVSGIGKPIHLHPSSVSLRLPRQSDSDDGPDTCLPGIGQIEAGLRRFGDED